MNLSSITSSRLRVALLKLQLKCMLLNKVYKLESFQPQKVYIIMHSKCQQLKLLFICMI